jgi:hypothetical protein
MQRFVSSRLLVALSVTPLFACGRGEAEPGVVNPAATISITGTIQFFSLEGGFFAIRADDGKTYDPINLPAEYHKDGIRVRFKGRLRTDLVGVHMIGPIVEIVAIETL